MPELYFGKHYNWATGPNNFSGHNNSNHQSNDQHGDYRKHGSKMQYIEMTVNSLRTVLFQNNWSNAPKEIDL